VSNEPINLNISLERKNRVGYWIVAGCVLFTGTSALVNVDFAIVFFSSCVVGLPMIWLTIISSKGRKLFSSWGDLGLVAFYAVLFAYIVFAKTLLVPALQSAIRHALA
jgi:hypothetical protein